jgi:hypothetical protein
MAATHSYKHLTSYQLQAKIVWCSASCHWVSPTAMIWVHKKPNCTTTIVAQNMLKVQVHTSQWPHAKLQTDGQQEFPTYKANQLYLTHIMQARIGYTWCMIAEWSAERSTTCFHICTTSCLLLAKVGLYSTKWNVQDIYKKMLLATAHSRYHSPMDFNVRYDLNCQIYL